jgi:acyl-CoA synthetase (AMP-forming)/AMP-acid ligase II
MFRKVGSDISMVPNFVEHLSDGGQSPALIFPGRAVITYDQLAQRVATLATSFGDEKRLIAIEASLSEHAIIAYIAALAGGHALAHRPRHTPVV